jgi:hypothetical protein
MRIFGCLALPLTLLLGAGAARADAPASDKTQAVSAPAGSGQDALWAQLGPKGIVARACSGACGPSADAAAIADVPAEVLPALASAKTSTITLADGKRVVRIDAEVPSSQGEPSAWTMFLAAPLSSAKSSSAVVLWSGFVGKKHGEEGEEAVQVVRVEALAKGQRIVVGEQRADLTICGRPAIVSAREVDPATLTLKKNAMVDSLSDADKKKAEKVIAVRETGAATPPTIRLLRATSASGALEKKIGTLTDGNVETGWTEAKIGDGHGEWVRMSASSDVGISGLSVQIRPTGEEVLDGAAPKTLYFATDERLFEVQIPDGAWGDRDARYEVKLPAEVRTACLAVVLGDAQTPKGVANPRVTIAEITAHTPLDAMSYEALAAQLASDGDKARAAAAMLGKGDARAVAAVAGTWDKLTDAGKAVAMDVVDAAPCTDQAPFYADRLGLAKGKKLSGATADPIVTHARDRLRRCGHASAPPLAKLLKEAPDPVKIAAAEELSLVSPPDAIAAILDALPSVPDPVRRDLRAALAKAASSAKARPALADWVTPARFGALGDVAKVDLLRAIGPVLPEIEGGKKALFGLAGKDAPFRTRYLLLAPAAELAAKGDAEAETFVKDALVKDTDPHVRARAAEVSGKVASLAPQLVAAIGDGEVRVREAAVRALAQGAEQGQKLPAAAEGAIVARLSGDEWTFVRVASAEALAAMPKSTVADKALATALGDRSADVRMRVLDALGAHQATAYASNVRDRAQQADEVVEVRASALTALGAMCDRDSVDMLAKLAMGARSTTSEVERRLGAAALSALGDLHPVDIESRLAPLLAKDSTPLVREMARSAIAAKPKCNPHSS